MNNVSNKKSSGIISMREHTNGVKPNSQYYKNREKIEQDAKNGKDSPNSMFMNYRHHPEESRYDQNRSRNRPLNTNNENLESEPDLDKVPF